MSPILILIGLTDKWQHVNSLTHLHDCWLFRSDSLVQMEELVFILLSNAMSWFVSRLLFAWIMDLAPSTQWLECLLVGEWHLLINSLTVFVCSSHHQVSQFGCLHAKFSPFWASLNQLLRHQDVWIQLYCPLIKELTYSQWIFIALGKGSLHIALV